MTSSGGSLKSSSRKSSYEAELGVYGYGKSGTVKICFPIRIRERHLTPGQTQAELQGIGHSLQISIWTERDNIIVQVPTVEWRATRTYSGKLHGSNDGLVSVGRFSDSLAIHEREDGSAYVEAEIIKHGYERSN
jgi:hypothetical protein